MAVGPVDAGGEGKGADIPGPDRRRLTLVYFRLLWSTQRAVHAALTARLVAEFGEGGGYEPPELVRRHRRCRQAAAERRAQAQDPGLSRAERAALLGRAARLETLADTYREVLGRRLEPLLARAAARMFPSGSYAFREMQEDFLQAAVLLVNRELTSEREPTYFEQNHLFVLVRIAFGAARTVGRAYGRGEDGRAPLPVELDALLGDADAEGRSGGGDTFGDLLPAPEGAGPDEQVFLSLLAEQLREGFVAASTQARALALRKFSVLCLRCADEKPADVRRMVAGGAHGVTETYSAESERVDYREAKKLLAAVLGRLERDAGEGQGIADLNDVVRALRWEGQRLVLACRS